MSMKARVSPWVALGLLCVGRAFAETDIAGDWRGKLAVDASTSVSVQFMFTKKPDGSYAAVLSSRENQFIQNVVASSVSWKDGALTVDVPALSGSYAGTLKDDHFEGQWSQAQSKGIPLALSRAPKPSKADLAALTGSWQGTLPNPTKPTLIFEFKPDANGGLAGSLSVPEQSALGIALANVEAGAGTIAFRIPSIGAEYRGTFSGLSMTGVFKQGTQSSGVPLNLAKGDFATPQRLGLSGEAWTVLYGNWSGKLGTMEAVLHFTTIGMEQVAFLDMPGQKAMNIPVTSATVTGKKIVLKVTAVGGEFSGDVAGGTLTGQWTQGGRSTPVTWTRQ